jgi:hypothetical protein
MEYAKWREEEATSVRNRIENLQKELIRLQKELDDK